MENSISSTTQIPTTSTSTTMSTRMILSAQTQNSPPCPTPTPTPAHTSNLNLKRNLSRTSTDTDTENSNSPSPNQNSTDSNENENENSNKRRFRSDSVQFVPTTASNSNMISNASNSSISTHTLNVSSIANNEEITRESDEKQGSEKRIEEMSFAELKLKLGIPSNPADFPSWLVAYAEKVRSETEQIEQGIIRLKEQMPTPEQFLEGVNQELAENHEKLMQIIQFPPIVNVFELPSSVKTALETGQFD